ncbi:MAG: PQQ-dependent sugar dehydrogenase [Polyangiales bacterium]
MRRLSRTPIGLSLLLAGASASGCASDSKRGGSDAGGSDAAVVPCGAARTVPTLATQTVGSGFSEPVFLASVPGTSDLAVVERGGRIRLVRGNTVLATDFLPIATDSMLDPSGYTAEQGLLGLAFHPGYATNGRFFVFRTTGSDDPGGRQNLVVEYARSTGNPDVADSSPVQTIVAATNDPQSNHNGGMLAFGPDGMLYVGIGDGGGADDQGHGPNGNALNVQSRFGKILRVDVDRAANGFVPTDPVYDGANGDSLVYAYGLRNPWRFSFDATTGTLFVGDVGQNDWEEIDAVAHADARGASFGWALREGSHDTSYPWIAAPTGYAREREIGPILDLGHFSSPIGPMTAVVGGYVYRGSAIPELQGFYLFGDTGGNVGALRYCEGRAADVQGVPGLSGNGGLYSFAVDAAGELYTLHGGGAVRRIVLP